MKIVLAVRIPAVHVANDFAALAAKTTAVLDTNLFVGLAVTPSGPHNHLVYACSCVVPCYLSC